VSDAEIRRLPDPDAFYDALDLVRVGRWSAGELDETDALLLALVRRLRTPVRKR
jgi:hypothetical protein